MMMMTTVLPTQTRLMLIPFAARLVTRFKSAHNLNTPRDSREYRADRGKRRDKGSDDEPSSTTRKLLVLPCTMASSPWMLPASSLTLAS
jgi:hypothetical protein